MLWQLPQLGAEISQTLYCRELGVFTCAANRATVLEFTLVWDKADCPILEKILLTPMVVVLFYQPEIRSQGFQKICMEVESNLYCFIILGFSVF